MSSNNYSRIIPTLRKSYIASTSTIVSIIIATRTDMKRTSYHTDSNHGISLGSNRNSIINNNNTCNGHYASKQ